jgi:hypothetical protein
VPPARPARVWAQAVRGGLDGRGIAADVADELGPGVGLDPLLVDLLRQRVGGKRGEGAAEGRFTGKLPAVVPTAKLAPCGAGLEGVQERAGGGELIDVLRLTEPRAEVEFRPQTDILQT